MQIKSLRLQSYNSCRVNTSATKIAKERLRKIEYYQKLRKEGCSEKTALEVTHLSRSTYYRWLAKYKKKGLNGLNSVSKVPRRCRRPQGSKQLEQQIKHLRKRHPMWGKAKITTLLKRERGLSVSESTVGRILKKLMTQGVIKPVAFYRGQVKPKKKRQFNSYAQRWNQSLKRGKAGQLIQVDHTEVTVVTGFKVKHFEAICPVTKILVAQTYYKATSRAAADFLKLMKKHFPFPIQSIQVDGGSEFRRHFETACQANQIKLFVLPPRSPELNGAVERSHRTLKEEFYLFYRGVFTLADLRKHLKDYLLFYNTFRPHQNLKQDTPWAYYAKIKEAA